MAKPAGVSGRAKNSARRSRRASVGEQMRRKAGQEEMHGGKRAQEEIPDKIKIWQGKEYRKVKMYEKSIY